jgi:hypothetical protein
MRISMLKLERVGQIQEAAVEFGDLTVLVGPQATGKSIFLQFLKLLLDVGYIHEQLRKHGIDWNRSLSDFLRVYLGEGMQNVWHSASGLTVNDCPFDIQEIALVRNRSRDAKLFYIPAQRVLSLANGWPRPFTAFGSEDPFVVRDFSETFRILMERELGRDEVLFPKTNRLKKEYRDLIAKHFFGGFGLQVDRHGSQKRLVLKNGQKHSAIPFMAWSAGQREFVPLLMGLYWLMPAAKVSRRDPIQWVVIEEPEMGLHPSAISVVVLLIAELLWRGYRVCLSTHSTHVIDLIWLLQTIRRHGGESQRFLDLFDIRKSDPVKEVAREVCQKEMRVYYFGKEGRAQDISNLDPGARNEVEAGWGGLTEWSGRVNELIASVVADGKRQDQRT